jgi:hypothetical protein
VSRPRKSARLTRRERGCYPERALQRPTGKINLIAVVLLLGAVAFIYSVIMFSKPLLDNLDVKEHIEAAYNQADGMDDQRMKLLIETRCASVGDHEEDDGFGTIRTRPGLGLTDENITIERNEVAQTISVRVEYARKVTLAPTTRVYILHFHPEISGPIIRR